MSSLSIIDEYAFEMTAITEIEILTSVTFIWENAFFGCEKLEKVDFEQNYKLKTIGKGAFKKSSLVKISNPPLVTEIYEETFKECHKLRQVDIPFNSEIQIIDSYAFEESRIKSIFIPAKNTKIGVDEFINFFNITFCKKLNLHLIHNLKQFQLLLLKIQIPKAYQFHRASKIYKIVHFLNLFLTKLIFLKTIGKSVFDKISIRYICIPPTITFLDSSSLRNCDKLLHIEFPKIFFNGCSSLINVKIPAYNDPWFLAILRKCKNLQIIVIAAKPDINLSDMEIGLKDVLFLILIE